MRHVITAFKEHKEFKNKKPWDATVFTFLSGNMITPPHYADTVEVLVYNNVIGDAHIGGQHFDLQGKRVLFVAPNVVHSMNYQKCDGTDITLKINVSQLKELVNIDAFLAYHNVTYQNLPIDLPEYDEVSKIADIFLNSNELDAVLASILRLFKLLIIHADFSISTSPSTQSYNEELRSIIEWTELNFKGKISLDSAAKKMGYNKQYFCKKFKASTGITYLTYLNNLRIYNACKLLKSGYSVNRTCFECGFDDTPYFIQLFKRITGMTPKKYQVQVTSDEENIYEKEM